MPVAGKDSTAITTTDTTGKITPPSGKLDIESFGDIKLSQPSTALIKILGEPDNKTKAIEWEADGLMHEDWTWKSKGLIINLSFEIKDASTLQVFSIKDRNAVQYTEQGFIRVEFYHRRLSISDSGIGIEPAYLPLLYERFFRGSTQGEGLGIGLAIVKRICNYYDWLIEVDSTPGKGTTFHITFPENFKG